MCFKINNKIIDEPLINIVKQVKSEIKSNKLKSIIDKGNDITITCPYHKNGEENKPSCHICADKSNKNLYGRVHCFSCKYSANIFEFIGCCFDEDENFGKEWLIERFGKISSEKEMLPKIILNKKIIKKKLNENILDSLQSYHPYMTQRKISNGIINKFKIKFDPKDQCIVFPIWDEKDDLVMLTRRSVNTKYFYIDKEVNKPVYLLNFIIKENIKIVYVCESQINALTLWSWGFPAIALIGTGSRNQYDILKKSGIRNYILCFDGDDAGDAGCNKFIANMPKDILISVKKIPRGKDVNDLDKVTFMHLPIV